MFSFFILPLFSFPTITLHGFLNWKNLILFMLNFMNTEIEKFQLFLLSVLLVTLAPMAVFILVVIALIEKEALL